MKLSSSPSFRSTVLAGELLAAVSFIPKESIAQQSIFTLEDRLFEEFDPYRAPMVSPCTPTRYVDPDWNKIPDGIRKRTEDLLEHMGYWNKQNPIKVNNMLLDTPKQAWGHYLCTTRQVEPTETDKTKKGLPTEVRDPMPMPTVDAERLETLERYEIYQWRANLTKDGRFKIGERPQIAGWDKGNSYVGIGDIVRHKCIQNAEMPVCYQYFQALSADKVAELEKEGVSIVAIPGFIERDAPQLLAVMLRILQKNAKTVDEVKIYISTLDEVQKKHRKHPDLWELKKQAYNLMFKIDPSKVEPFATKIYAQAIMDYSKGNSSSTKTQLQFLLELPTNSVTVKAGEQLAAIINADRIEDSNYARAAASERAAEATVNASDKAKILERERQEFQQKNDEYNRCMKEDKIMCIKPYL